MKINSQEKVDWLCSVVYYKDGDLYYIKDNRLVPSCWRSKEGRSVVVTVHGHMITKHRAIWAVYYKKASIKSIDHVDRDPSNNKIENLRECSQHENNGNYSVSIKNKSGHPGVSWHKRHNKWRVMIGRGESYEWLGLYDNFEEAVSVYRLAHIKKWGKFSPYLHDTPNFMPITRELDYIKRWQIVRTIRQQTVAAHSYYVSLYFIELCKVSGIALTPEAIAWVLEHDFEETHTGDIPTPAKENITFNNVKRTNQYFMNKDEYKIFKMADLLDALFFLIEERLLGNKTVKMVESEVEGKLLKMCGEGSLKEYIVELIDAHRSYQGRVK